MSYDAELRVIGSILIRNECINEIDFIAPDMFSAEHLGRMFAVCQKILRQGQMVDAQILAEAISDEIYPIQFAIRDVGECLRATETSAMVRQYARSVYTANRARIFRKAINSVSGDENTLDDEIQSLSDTLDSIRLSNDTGSKLLPQIVKENKDKYFCEIEKPKVDLGFKKLDDLLGGLEGGDMIIIGARPAVGKSAFASQITMTFAELGKKVGYFNLEMQEKQVYERFVAAKSGIELTRIRRAIAYQNDEEDRFRKANEYLAQQRNIVITTGSKRVSEIRSDAKRQQYDVVIVDYLQLLRPDRTYGSNRYAEVGAISHACKNLAMEMNIPVIVLCQLNRVSEMRDDKEPTMSELRESGDIEQDASVILLLWNTDKEDRTKKRIKVEKQRQGKTGKVDLHFDGNHMRFYEADEFYSVEDDEVVFD